MGLCMSMSTRPSGGEAGFKKTVVHMHYVTHC